MYDYRRVAIIKGALWGSGYLIAPRLVLTAKHVVGSVEPEGVVVVGLLRDLLRSQDAIQAQMRPAKVLWPTLGTKTELDFALLLTDDPAENSDSPVSWAELPKFGNQDLIAIGFPDSVNRAEVRDGLTTKDRDTREVHGTIHGADRLRARALARTVDFRVEPMWERSTYDWQGMSGAAVFASGDLVGIVAKADQILQNHVLKMLPIDQLFKEESFQAAMFAAAISLPQRKTSPDDAYWSALIRGGGPTPTHPIFVGRKEALRELVAWLKGDKSGGKAYVVVGGPGTGKSTLLARIVGLSHRALRESATASIQPDEITSNLGLDECSVNVAIYAGLKTLRDVSLQIASATNSTKALAALEIADQAEDVRQAVTLLVDEISALKTRSVILLDALDESQEPSEIARYLIQKLSRFELVWLLVASQPDTVDTAGQRLRSIGTASVEIDLENDKYIGQDDIRDYVTQILRCSSSVDWEASEMLRTALEQNAESIASRAGKVFLLANLLALACIDGLFPITADGEILVDELPSSVEGAFDIYLKRFDAIGRQGVELDKRRAIDLMVPLAYAEGSGLPLDNWADLASRLSGRKYTDSDIRLFLDHAGPLVVRTVDSGAVVYRVYHGLLARHLRIAGFEKEANRRFVEILTASVPDLPNRSPDWSQAHSYVRKYIALHAAKAGLLDQLLPEASFLAAADANSLLPLLRRSKPSSKAARDASTIYRLASHILRSSTLEQRAAQLELCAKQNARENLAAAFQALPYDQRWRTLWSDCRPSIPHIVLGGHDSFIRAVCIGSDAGEDLVISGDDGGTVRLWNLASGELLFQLKERTFGITDLAVDVSPSGTRVIAGDNEGRLTCWDLRQQTPIWKRPGDHWHINAVTVSKTENWTLVFAASRDLITAHHTETGELMTWHSGQFSKANSWADNGEHETWRGATALTSIRHDNKSFLIAGDDNGTIRVVDLSNPDEPIIFRAHNSTVYSLRAFESDTGIYLASASTEAVCVWDMRTLDKPLSKISTFNSIEGATETIVWFDVVTENGQTLIVLGRKRDLRVCDKRGRGVTIIPEAHNGSIGPVVSGKLRRDKVLVSAGEDHFLRIWDLREILELSSTRDGGQETAVAVANARIGEQECVLCGYDSGWIRSIDPNDRRPLGWTHSFPSQDIFRLSVVEGASATLVVIVGDLLAEVWNPSEDTSVKIQSPEEVKFMSATADVIGSETIVAVGNSKGEIGVYAISSPRPTSCEFLAHVHRSINEAEKTTHRSNVGTISLLELHGEARILSSGWENYAIGMWTLDGQARDPDPLPPRWHTYIVATAVDRAVGTRFLAIGDFTGTCTVWDLHGQAEPIKIDSGDGAKEDNFRRGADANWVRVIRFAKIDGRDTICVGYRDGTVGLYDPWSGTPLTFAQTGSSVFTNGLAADSSGRIVVANRRGMTAIKIDAL